jgi:uncharacterized membrane protein
VEAEFNQASTAPAVDAAPEAPPDVSDTGRVEAFSDGVFAVAITLLVLNLRVPIAGVDVKSDGQDVLGFLGTQWPSYLAYVTSFLTVLVIWLNHHMLFKLIGHADQVLMIYNGLLLMLVCIVPFSTSLLAEYVTSTDMTNQRVVGVVYSGLFILVSIAFNLLWRYASTGRRLLDEATRQEHIDGVNRSFRLGPLAYIVALALAFVDVRICIGVNCVLAIYWALPHTPRSAKAASRRAG